MTQSFDARIHNVTIPAAGTATRAIQGIYEYSDATAIFIQAPAALDVGTYVIQISPNGVDTWTNLSDGANDIAAPAAGKSRQYIEMIAAPWWRISGPTAAAERTFIVSKQWTA